MSRVNSFRPLVRGRGHCSAMSLPLRNQTGLAVFAIQGAKQYT